MAKEITGYVKLQIKGGQANPAPPVGPALGQRGINIMEFCKAFNEKTKAFMGKPVPVVITVYKDKKFDFIIKSPPASHFIREAAKLKSGSKEPGRVVAGSITRKQAEGIAKECARFVLPLATPTRLYMSGTVRSWIHYIDLRSGNGTQKEHRDIAEECKKIFSYYFPTIAKALNYV